MTIYSHSRLSSFENCPLKYKYKYIDKLKSEIVQTIEAFLGNRVHNALEKLYKDLKFNKLNTLQELLDFYNKEWDEKWEEGIYNPREQYSFENFKDMGIRFITDYYKRYHPFNQDKTISVEGRVEIDLDKTGSFLMQGFIDRLAYEGDGVYAVHDYKTANTLMSQPYADSDRQLALYSIAIKENYTDCTKVKLIWHYLAFDKDVFSERTDKELEELKINIINKIKEIESAKDFPAKESPLCPWCEFRPICPKFKHLYKLEKQIDNEHIGDEGSVLVDKYAELKKKEKEIQNEISKVSEAIFLNARENNYEVLFGSNHKVRLWSKMATKLPTKKDPLFLEIQKLLKAIGKFEEVETYDSWKLAKIIDDRKWPEEILSMLSGFGRKEKVERLYLSDR